MKEELKDKIMTKPIEENEKLEKENGLSSMNEQGEGGILDEETKNQIINDLAEKAAANGKKMLTYTEVSDRLGDMDIDKDQMDDIYDSLMNKGIEVSMESEPDDIELMEMDDEEVDDPEVEAVIAEKDVYKRQTLSSDAWCCRNTVR